MTVLEAVQRSKTLVFLNKKAIQAAQEMLSPTEDLLWAQTSSIYKKPVHGELSTEIELINTDMLPGVIVVTNKRILFVHCILTDRSFKEILISDIRSMDAKANFTIEVLRIVGSTSMIVAFDKRKVMLGLRNAIQEAIAKRKAQQSDAIQITSNDDALDSSDIQQLQALKQLYDAGVITAEEFSAKKAQILNLD